MNTSEKIAKILDTAFIMNVFYKEYSLIYLGIKNKIKLALELITVNRIKHLQTWQ